MGPVNLVSCTICSKIINSTVISHSVLFVLVSVVLLPHESQLDSRLTLQVFSNISAGVGLALMVTVTTAVSFYCWAIKKRELGRNRAELFRKNGGLLLQQRFSTSRLKERTNQQRYLVQKSSRLLLTTTARVESLAEVDMAQCTRAFLQIKL